MSCPKRVVILSNRLPLNVVSHGNHSHSQQSAGGLVTALQSVLVELSALWIGWAGTDDQAAFESFLRGEAANLNPHLIPVYLSQEERAKFYRGFSNEILWPLFHDLQSRCNFDPSYWEAYCDVNQKYADCAMQLIQPHDFVWIHDYHLLLTGKVLRDRGLQSVIAYFHHIPFPAPDIFEKLPWRGDLLHAMLQFDVLGFQTARDRRNFVGCLNRLVSAARIRNFKDRTMIKVQGRCVMAGTFPISIDFEEFSSKASAESVGLRAIAIRKNLRVQHCILGVDRLDYTKGIPERLRAFQRLLEECPELHKRISLVQVTTPSREDIPKYQDLKLEVERIVTAINGRFTQPGWIPIHYLYRQLERNELLAYYRAADIGLVTPLKDGMNLVSKEFCASQVDEDAVLILSEFAGAAPQLGHAAILVNPNDVNSVAAALSIACRMSKSERQEHMRSLRRSIEKEDVHAWFRSYWNAVEITKRSRKAGNEEGAFSSAPRSTASAWY